jgi:hypothetical protein
MHGLLKVVIGLFFSRPGRGWFLTAGCIAGELIGLASAMWTGFLFPLVRGAIFWPKSTVPAVLLSFIPFLIAAFAVQIKAFPILVLTAFVRSFLHGYLAGAVVLQVGSAGWLVQPLFQFSGNVLLAVFWGYSLHLMLGRVDPGSLGIILLFAAVVTILDVYVIAPFLVRVMDHRSGEVRYSCWILCRLMKIT